MKWSSLRPWIARGIKQLKVRDNFGIEGILFCSTPIQGRSESRVLEAIIMPGHSFREGHLSDTGADDKTAFVRYSQLITLPNYTVSLFMSLKAHVAKKKKKKDPFSPLSESDTTLLSVAGASTLPPYSTACQLDSIFSGKNHCVIDRHLSGVCVRISVFFSLSYLLEIVC